MQYARPTADCPPIVRNFTVIPVCSFKRRHIRIDASALLGILAELGIAPVVTSAKTGALIQMGQSEFTRDGMHKRFWPEYFNMRKINQLVKFKKNFHYQIMTDGVSASVLYKKQKQKAMSKKEEKARNKAQKKQFDEGHFKYIIGVDPGMNTWLAAVRRTVLENKEVTFLFY